MPEMNGMELAEVLRGLEPGLKVLLMSGYSAGSVISSHPEEMLLQKPFSIAALLLAVSKALNSSQCGSRPAVPAAQIAAEAPPSNIRTV